MKTPISQQEAARLLGITDREVRNRLASGDYQSVLEDTHWHGGQVRRVVLESLPAAGQLAWWKRPHAVPQDPGDRRSPLQAGAIVPAKQDSGFSTTDSGRALPGPTEPLLDAHPTTSPEQCKLPQPALPSARQLSLPLEDGEAFRYLPPALREYVEKWFQILSPTDVLHWNGLWKSRYFNQTFYVASPDGGLPRQFKIDSKTALIEYLAASHSIPVRTLYTRRQELLNFFGYLDQCRKSGAIPEASTMAAFFPAHTKDWAERLRPRADKGVSKSITPEVQEWLLARLAQGSRPGSSGWRSSLADALRALSEMRCYLELQGMDPDASGLKVPSVSAVRRWWNAWGGRGTPWRAPTVGPPSSDPAVIWSRQGSKRYHELVIPSTPRIPPPMVYDWWESDHRKANVWVYLDFDPTVVIRPWSTWWYDVCSRWPMAFVLSIVPSSVTIMRAWKEALLRHLVAPRHTTCDNGKDYLAHVLDGDVGARHGVPLQSNDELSATQLGLIRRFGTEPHHTLPSSTNQRTGETECHAQSKLIERFFQNLDGFDRSLRGACGESPESKPDKIEAELLLHREAVAKWDGAGPLATPLMSQAEYRVLLSNFLCTDYGNRTHRGEGMNCTPLEAFERYQPERFGVERRRLTADQVNSLMLTPPRPAKVHNLEISIDLSGHVEHYRDPAFMWLTGQTVMVEVDPAAPDVAWVSHDGQFVARADRVGKLAYGNASQALVQAEQKLKAYVLRATKERVNLLGAATFLPSAEQLAGMREAIAASRGDPVGRPDVPHAESLERGRRALAAQPAEKLLDADSVADRMIEAMTKCKG